MKSFSVCTALALTFAIGQAATTSVDAQSTNNDREAGDRGDAVKIVKLPDWRPDALYGGGVSVDHLLDDVDVTDVNGDQIGDIENIVFTDDGRVLSIIAEVGGFWDILDTHINVPWEEATYSDGAVNVPITPENYTNYGMFEDAYLLGDEAAADTKVVDDDLNTGPRAFRASELIGDYARIRVDGGFANYGYIDDLIIRDGRLAAIIVNPQPGYGVSGRFAFPYYGYNYSPGGVYYDMPYQEAEVTTVEPFDYDEFETLSN